jgi:hypothetical protein
MYLDFAQQIETLKMVRIFLSFTLLFFLGQTHCPADLPGRLARQTCPASLPGSLARQPCPAALPGSFARQPCPAALQKYYKLKTGRRPAQLQAFQRRHVALHTFTGRRPAVYCKLFPATFPNKALRFLALYKAKNRKAQLQVVFKLIFLYESLHK